MTMFMFIFMFEIFPPTFQIKHATEDVEYHERHLDALSAYKSENYHKRYKRTIHAGPLAEKQLL